MDDLRFAADASIRGIPLSRFGPFQSVKRRAVVQSGGSRSSTITSSAEQSNNTPEARLVNAQSEQIGNRHSAFSARPRQQQHQNTTRSHRGPQQLGFAAGVVARITRVALMRPTALSVRGTCTEVRAIESCRRKISAQRIVLSPQIASLSTRLHNRDKF